MPEVPIYAAIPGTATERFVSGQPDDKYRLALVFKRAFKISPTGLCVPLSDPIPIENDSMPWDPELKPPLASPPRCDSDLFAFKPATDVVVQGHAYTYSRLTSVETELRVGPLSRTVRVHGDRRAEWSGNRAAFTAAQPFEKMPLRYDRAYGGVDTVALARQGDPLGKAFQSSQPAYADDLARSTPFHYPRNPAGCGYLITADRESLEAARIPNLEFPFDPITPERLAVGDSKMWLRAPLPAAFDWSHIAWFPRLAYLGQIPEHTAAHGEVPEASKGWVPREILNLSKGRMLFFDPRFQQGASPGLAIPNLPPDAEFVLKNLFPAQPERRVRLPGVLPKVLISLKPSDQRAARTQLNAVIIQPDLERVILVFAAVCEVARKYGNHEMAAMKWSIA
jgi:hypothetical protein